MSQDLLERVLVWGWGIANAFLPQLQTTHAKVSLMLTLEKEIVPKKVVSHCHTILFSDSILPFVSLVTPLLWQVDKCLRFLVFFWLFNLLQLPLSFVNQVYLSMVVFMASSFSHDSFCFRWKGPWLHTVKGTDVLSLHINLEYLQLLVLLVFNPVIWNIRLCQCRANRHSIVTAGIVGSCSSFTYNFSHLWIIGSVKVWMTFF